MMLRASEFKARAREKMFTKYGTLAGATFIYGAILIAIGMACLVVYSMNLMVNGVFTSIETMQAYIDQTATNYSYTLIYEAVFVFIGALMSTAAGGIQYMCLKVARDESVKISDMLYVVKNNPDKIIIIYLVQQLLMFLFSVPADIIAVFANRELVPGVLEILYFIFMTFGYIADITVIVLFSQAIFIYIDNPQEKVLTCIESSINLMKKNYGRYFRLLISFIPLYLLVAFTFGLAMIWVLPYQYTTMALFYTQLKGERGSRIDVLIK